MNRVLRYWLPVFAWMGFIFLMSTDLGSSGHTSRLIEPLLRLIDPRISAHAIDTVHFLVRKGGHLSEYAILSLLWLRALNSSFGGAKPGRFWRSAGLALLASMAYAATDEFHQSFVPGRTAAVGDVLIDSSGALIALTAAVLRRHWSHAQSRADRRPA